MRIPRTIFLVVLALSTSSAVAATGHPAGHEAGKTGDMKGCGMMHDGMKMHEGMMSPAEHRKHADEMFRMLDANKDGTITRAEFDRHHEDMMKRHDHKPSAPAAAPRT